MNNNYKYYLLLLHKKRPVESLLKLGLDYAQIAIFVNQSIREGHATVDASGINITESGLIALFDTSTPSESLREFNIIPENNSRIPKISQEDIYIPSIKSLKGLLK